MSPGIIIIASVLYLALLFLLAAYLESDKGRKLVKNPYIYAFSLGVYCTAWTFYGSVGRAAEQGFSFLPIYLGPTLLAPLWMIVLRKIIYISQYQRITSIADFLSSRYGKSTSLGIIASLLSMFAIVPYISIQLKGIANSFYVLLAQANPYRGEAPLPFYLDSALYISIALAIFIILFGARKLDPNEKHEGLVGAIAAESLLKLIAFLAAGIFVTFVVFNGFGDLFRQGLSNEKIAELFVFNGSDIKGYQWFWLTLLSRFAILLLPRQFHIAVVENNSTEHIRKASWVFPLYLLLINVFVLPIAVGGLLLFREGGVSPDTFVLSIPLQTGRTYLALFIALGGFAAATSMVIVSVIALSIMLGNNLVLPILLNPKFFRQNTGGNLTGSLLGIRRVSILLILLLAYSYFRSISQTYSLVSIGLISFAGIAQFAPALIAGLYWKGGTKKGAIAGLLVGSLIWMFTLPVPSLLEASEEVSKVMRDGLFGWSFLRPYALFGMQESNHVVHAAFWSLGLNTLTFFVVSLYSRASALELSQADIFVDIYKYRNTQTQVNLRRRQASIQDIQLLLNRFLGESRRKEIFRFYERKKQVDLSQLKTGSTDFVNLAETHLAGSIGASSAKILIGAVSKEDPISLEEMFRVLENTQEIIQYSKALERKSEELQSTTKKLRKANEQLKELERLKADFITTVTHELRTPITSMKAIAKIMLDTPHIEQQQKSDFLNILVQESERISRLINQVLDLEKIASPTPLSAQPVDFKEVVQRSFDSLLTLAQEKGIYFQLKLKAANSLVLGNQDRLQQIVINLLSNAIKFCDSQQGKVWILLTDDEHQVYLSVKDNGKGIPKDKQQFIFERFTQLTDQQEGKPTGSGLGLFITHTIVKNHQGDLKVFSQDGEGANFILSLPKFLLPLDALTYQ